MSPTIEEQIEGIKRTIAEMEAQRESLGDEVVDAGLAPFRRKLDGLVAMLQAREAQPPAEPARQRKLVTLLFMDIAGSTAIAQHMDPEDVGEVFDAALKKLAQPVKEYGGRVTRFMGDGFLSVFGAPTVHEDDPEQAVRAGLKIIQLAGEVAGELEKQWEIEGFQVRVGINTGLVLLGGETEAEDTLMGSPVNLAARLESAAPSGGLLVSHDTYRHIRGVFDVQPWEPLNVKGFDEPVQVYRILRTKPRAFRSYTRGVEGVETRMVGRETELKYLQDALLSAVEEKFGQIVTITGEAGVGKSRLLYEFENWIELQLQQVFFFEGRSRQEAQGVPYGLLHDLFEFRFQIQEDDSAETAREKVESGSAEVFAESDEGQLHAHILGHLLGFDFSASPHLKGVIGDAEQLRNRGLMYLGEYFRGLCRQGPVVILMEDIHWADDSSLDALSWLGERLHRHQLLVVCAARHSLFERRPYWGEGLAYHHCLELEPLSRRESRQLVEEILKLADQIPPELFDLVVESAEGNPFYVEELVKMLVEDGVIVKGEETWQVHPERLSEIEVPPTLAGVLQARLDSLPIEERVVLQQASVVGRLFWDRVVAHIQAAEGGRPQAVSEALTSLRGREMVYRREASAFIDANEFLFKHDILREVTYESVLKRLRRVYHGIVADWLISQAAERIGEYSGMIAGHLLLAGRKKLACQYFLQAGKAALSSYANHEAERYFRQVLDLSSEIDQRAACLKGLGEALRQQGSRQEAAEIFRQAIDLHLKLGDNDGVADLYARLARVLWFDDYGKAWDACQEGLARLEGAPESPGLARLLAETVRAASFWHIDKDEVIQLCQQAVEVAQHVGNIEAELETSITLVGKTEVVKNKNPKGYVNMLRQIAIQAEENGLLRPAARAYNNIGGCNENLLYNINDNWELNLRAAEILGQIGDIELLLFVLYNLAGNLIALGHLKTVEGSLVEILRNSTASESQIEEFLDKVRSDLLLPRGEWMQALSYLRANVEKLHEGQNIQNIGDTNTSLAFTILEQNRFERPSNLSEAEAALLENIQIDRHVFLSRFRLVVLASRRERFGEARELLGEAIAKSPGYISYAVERLYAEAELARMEERWDVALKAYQELIDYDQKGGYRWNQTRRLIDLGDALLGRDGPGDREQADEAYKQSLEMFTEMGAPGYIRVLEERLGGM